MQKYKHLFDTRHLQTDLKKRSLRSGAITLTSQAAKFVIQLGSTIILARILTPEDYGIMAMVVSITGFAGLFINLGLSTAVIQRAEINHAQVSTLFWINAGIGAFVMLLVASLSPVVAWFYQTPALKWLTLALSCNFLINGLAVQHHALLNRQMKFFSIAIIQVVGILAGILVAIIAAINGFGYWALVFNSLTVSGVSFIGGWFASGWLPGLPNRNSGVGEMIRFGSDIVGFNIINFFCRNLDNILIGRYCGSGALGLYSKAYQLLMMPITNLREPMNKVGMPALSRLQNEPEQYRKYYMKYVSLLSFLSMPLVAFLFIFSDNIIRLVLGDQWMGASILFKILAIVSFIQPVSSTRGLVLLTTGKSRRYLLLGIVSSITVIAAFIIGVQWGAIGVAAAYLVHTYLFLFPYLIIGFHGTPVNIKDFVFAIFRPTAASIAMGIVCYFLRTNITEWHDFYILSVAFVFAIFTYLIFYAVLPKGKYELKEFFNYSFEIFKR